MGSADLSRRKKKDGAADNLFLIHNTMKGIFDIFYVFKKKERAQVAD